MRLTQIIEALLFASDAPLTAADLARIDERLDEDTVTAVIEELRAEYDLSERSFQIYEVAGGFQLLTRPEFVAVLERYDTVPHASRLSTPALEVLAIIAYRQPLGRTEIEEIRGVQSAAVLRTLQDRSLIEPVGRSEALGRPLLYGTTSKFLEHFGFRSLEELPRPDELPVVLRTRPAVAPEGAAAQPAAEGEPAVAGEPTGEGAHGVEGSADVAAPEAEAQVPATADAAEPEAGRLADAAEPEAGVLAAEEAAAAEPEAGVLGAEEAAAAEPGVAADEVGNAEPVHAGAAAQQVLEAAAAMEAELEDDAQDEDAAAASVRDG
jgi:segregation and condensation protein B